MPASIPTEIKESVVQSWFYGLTRRQNAIKHNVSEGAVDNFIKDWIHRRGPDGEYGRLRALAVATSKSGLSVLDCAEGHRIVMIMKNIGVSEDDYEIFISKLSKRYVASGLDPGTLVEQINQLHFFLENNQSHIGMTTSLSQLLEVFKLKLDEIRDLELKKQNLEKTIRKLYIDKETVEAELDWDSELKEKLNKHGFKKEDVPKFVDAALLMKGRHYNIFDIMERFSKFEEIDDACFSVQRKKVDLEQRHNQLLMENQDLEDQISRNSLKLHDLDSLKALGFGLAEFRMLRDIITEVGEERGLIGNDAVKDFFQDLENYYYEYLRLRTSVSKLKTEKAQASAANTSNQIIGMFQNFFKQQSESLSESTPKYNPNTEVSGVGKKVKHVDNNDVASTHGLQSESPIKTLYSNEELQQEDNSYERSYKEQVVERESTQENSNRKLQLNSASLRGSKMKIENKHTFPQDQKVRSCLGHSSSSSSPKPYQLKNSTGVNSVSNETTPNIKSHRATEPNELYPSLSSIQDGILNTIKRSLSEDHAEESTD